MLRIWFEALRPRQWVKNGVVVAAWIDSGRLLDLAALGASALVFVWLCLLSSAAYLVNDIADVERDRRHPRKRLAPLASGRMQRSTAAALAVVLGALGLAGAWRTHPLTGAFLAGFLALQMTYTAWLRHQPFADVIAIAAGFTLRLVSATVALTPNWSPWLILACFFASLFMVLNKRQYEALHITPESLDYRPSLAAYEPALLAQVIPTVAAAAVTMYCAYAVLNPFTPLLLATAPFLIYGIIRYQQAMTKHHIGGESYRVFLEDRLTIGNLLVWLSLTIVLILADAR
ncbi:MAG TPA: UbiA family prenyltransferase [Anaerolineales bacterium]|nr:UbiA family prenyltransferase [Anaerolineales bacterium]